MKTPTHLLTAPDLWSVGLFGSALQQAPPKLSYLPLHFAHDLCQVTTLVAETHPPWNCTIWNCTAQRKDAVKGLPTKLRKERRHNNQVESGERAEHPHWRKWTYGPVSFIALQWLLEPLAWCSCLLGFLPPCPIKMVSEKATTALWFSFSVHPGHILSCTFFWTCVGDRWLL